MAAAQAPPAYTVPVLYDETHRGRWAFEPCIASVGNLENLTGYLEHLAPTTDGSFSICVAGGEGNFRLYESIPEAHRPVLNTKEDGVTVEFPVLGSHHNAIGSIIMPIILTNADTNTRFCIKVHALVMPDLLMGMFIGQQSAFKTWLKSTTWGDGKVIYECDFGNGLVHVQHKLR